MKKTPIVLLFLFGVIFFTYSQSCAPSACDVKTACGPGDTKKAEAKIITDLKMDYLELKGLASNVTLPAESDETTAVEMTLPLDMNNEEDAIILDIKNSIDKLSARLNTKFDRRVYNNKAELVRDLRIEISELKSNIQSLADKK